MSESTAGEWMVLHVRLKADVPLAHQAGYELEHAIASALFPVGATVTFDGSTLEPESTAPAWRPGLRSWWVTFRYGSRFTRAGRALRRSMTDIDDPSMWLDVRRPHERES